MAKYVCLMCGYIYDEADGAWEDLPEDWACPLCGAPKTEFAKEESELVAQQTPTDGDKISIENSAGGLTSLEMSALCSNLARGLEQQYKHEESAAFRELSAYFKGAEAPAEDPGLEQLKELLEKDLNEDYPNAHKTAGEAKDRGALRALVWTDKVSRIVKSLLTRYEKEGEALVAATNVYVCTICGFIYVGDKLPDICPICKVPNWKFEMVKER
ncbi:MAG TPA: rubredoxin [Bacillota bacterium]|nr:rubredoxin [Bacillota bacterium]